MIAAPDTAFAAPGSALAAPEALAAIDRADALGALLARSVRQRGPVLARKHLPEAEAFRQDIGADVIKKDGTLEQIRKRLKRWNKLEAQWQEGGKSEKNDFERVATANLIKADVEHWLEAHPARTADATVRAAVQKLGDDADKEIKRLSSKAVKRHGLDADKRLKTRLAAKDMHSAFEYLAPIIDMAVPNAGSKAEIEGEIEFAVDPNMVGFVGIRLKLEAERAEEDRVKGRAELTFTAGAKFPNLGRVRFDIGGYLEAQAKTAKAVAQLVSYGLYRTARRRRDVPRWFVNKLWGGEWDSDPGYANAERWAGSIETGIMAGNANAYVEAGMMAGAMAELGFQAGSVAAKAKILGQLGGGERWDEAGIKAIAQEKGKLGWSEATIADIVRIVYLNPDRPASELHESLKHLGHDVSTSKLKRILKQAAEVAPDRWSMVVAEEIVRDASPGQRPVLGQASKEEGWFGKQKGRGERTFWVKAQAEADITVATMAMKYERHYKSTGRDSMLPSHLREHKIEGRFGVKLPLHVLLGGDLLALLMIEKGINAMASFVRTQETVTEEKVLSKKERKARKAGAGIRIGGDLASVVTQLSELPAKSFTWSSEAKSAINPGMFGSVALVVVMDAKFKNAPRSDGKKDLQGNPLLAYEINLQIAEEKAFKYEADLAAVAGRIAGKTQERWLRAQKKDGVWKVDFIGRTAIDTTKKKAEKDKKKAASLVTL